MENREMKEYTVLFMPYLDEGINVNLEQLGRSAGGILSLTFIRVVLATIPQPLECRDSPARRA